MVAQLTLQSWRAGIAEFLLPLVFAGHVRQITWIKSPWANQVRVVVPTL
jgi:hypothetical protein